MAQLFLEKIKKLDKERNTVHTKVLATYSTFEDNGEKYFQIDTYGRLTRETPEKISQSFQLDKDAAKVLIQLLSNEFDL